jgi:hypothetical protein
MVMQYHFVLQLLKLEPHPVQLFTLLAVAAQGQLGNIIVGILEHLHAGCILIIFQVLLHAGLFVLLLSDPDGIFTLLEMFLD